MWCRCSEAAAWLPQPDKRDWSALALKLEYLYEKSLSEQLFWALMWSSDNSNKHRSHPNYMGNRKVWKSPPKNSKLYVLHGTERNELTANSGSCCDLGQALLILLNYSLISVKSPPRGWIIFAKFLGSSTHLLRFMWPLSVLVYNWKTCVYYNDI